jgi:hypothetical protein
MASRFQSWRHVFLVLCAVVMTLGVQGSRAHDLLPVPGSVRTAGEPRSIAPIHIPAVFAPNVGQYDARVRYSSQGAHHAIFATDTGMTLVFEPAGERGLALRLSFVDAAAGSHVEPSAPDRAHLNYFMGQDRRGWRTNLPTYHDVLYRDVWPGVDASFIVGADRLKYEFHVKPGADPSRIKLRYEGAAGLRVGEHGELRIRTATGTLTDDAPRAFQRIAARTAPVAASYAVSRDGEYGITLGAYDRTQPLVIDPSIVYASYLGGAGADYGNGVAVDAAGNAYVVGTTGSIDFPVTAGAFQTTLGDVDPRDHSRLDAFVAKVSADGSRLIYATYLGGRNEDYGNAIAVDGDGDAYVTGSTHAPDFPTTDDAFQRVFPGGESAAFMTKLDATGSSLMYSTYYGGTGSGVSTTAGNGIALDASGHAYVVGDTTSRSLPGTDTGFSGPQGWDGFLIRLSVSGGQVEYGTYISGSAFTYANGVAVQGTRAFVTGTTESFDFPTTEGAFDRSGIAPLLKTTDGGQRWQDDHGLQVQVVSSFAQDPTDASVIYAGVPGQGIYQSTDGGSTFTWWGFLYADNILSLAVDPTTPTIVYAATYSYGVHKSTDGGRTWAPLNLRWISDLAVDGTGAVFAAGVSAAGVWKSTDGGSTWTRVLSASTAAVLADPSTPGTVLAGGYGHLYRSSDDGATWTTLPAEFGFILRLRMDTSTTMMYAASRSGLWRSEDHGVSFTLLPGFPAIGDIAIDSSTSPSTIYSLGEPNTLPALLKSTDGGETASELLVNGGTTTSLRAIAVVGPSSVLIGGLRSRDAFVTCVDTSQTGTRSLVYSTYLSGSMNDGAFGIAVDADGRAYVAGYTNSGDFPLTVPHPPRLRAADYTWVDTAWVAKITEDGSSLVYANTLVTGDLSFARGIAVDASGDAYIAGGFAGASQVDFVAKLPPDGGSFDVLSFGGTRESGARAIAVDADGAAYVVGTTGSTDFPATDMSFQPWLAGVTDAFIAKIVFGDLCRECVPRHHAIANAQ